MIGFYVGLMLGWCGALAAGALTWRRQRDTARRQYDNLLITIGSAYSDGRLTLPKAKA